MFKNILKSSFINLGTYKSISLINIFGLATSLAIAILLIAYLENEFSYDSFSKNSDRIYRVVTSGEIKGKEISVAYSPPPMGPALKNDFPEIVEYARLKPVGLDKRLVKIGDKKFYEKKLFYADSTFLEIFDYKFLYSNFKNPLAEPLSVIISENISKKYFGDENPIGRSIQINGLPDHYVSGVIKGPPTNSHLHFNFLLNFPKSQMDKHWMNFNSYTYLLVSKGFDVKKFEEKIPQFIDKYLGQELKSAGIEIYPYLQSLKSIHLNSHLEFEIEANSSITNVYILIALMILLLVSSSINYVNLSITRLSTRLKEVSIRKVIGATKSNLILQFLSDSIIATFISLVLALVFVELLSPIFYSLTNFKVSSLEILKYWYILLFAILLIGTVNGIVPAYILAEIKPSSIFRGFSKLKVQTKKLSFSKVFIFLQFVIAGFLIVCVITVHEQLKYMQNKDLGFDKEQIIVVPIRGETLKRNLNTFKSQLKNINGITNVAATSYVPGDQIIQQLFRVEGSDDSELLQTIKVDDGFIDTYKIKLLEGRNFSEKFSTDTENAMLLNETARIKLGLQEPIGTKFTWYLTGEKKWTVIGIIDDIHLSSLEHTIAPMVFQNIPNMFKNISIRINNEHISDIINKIQIAYESFDTVNPFEYYFLDSKINLMYKNQKQLQTIISYLSILAIFISAFGLYGLLSLTLSQSKKDNGIRRILGASVSSILFDISKKYILLLLSSFLISFSLAYYFMENWLSNFAYRTDFTITFFIAAAAVIILITIITISLNLIKLIKSDPVAVLQTNV